MYDAENVEFKFSRLRRHLKLQLGEQSIMGKVIFQIQALPFSA